MKVIVTGTVGLDKAPYLEKVAQLAGKRLSIYHVGQRMYAEAPDIAPGRILDLPLSRLHLLRRSVFKDILARAQNDEHLIVNTHATFRWRHGLFPAFDFDHLARLNADMYVCLMDNVDTLHARLEQDHRIDHSLKDLLVWREEELLGTEMMMHGCTWPRPDHPHPRFYALAMGRNLATAVTLFRLMFQPQMRKVYVSFPMTHVMHMTEVLEEITAFRQAIWDHFIVFDPGDLEEQQLYQDAVAASERGRRWMEVHLMGRTLRFDVAEVMQVAGDIHAQIYARDFMLIDQADMILSYIPALPNGQPGLSSGVERELQHAHEATREVYVIWRPRVEPSPFITETATRVFTSTTEALDYFHHTGHIPSNLSQTPLTQDTP